MTDWSRYPKAAMTHDARARQAGHAASGNPSIAASIDAISTKLLGTIEGLVDDIQASRVAAHNPPPADLLPLTEGRRRLVHILRLPRICTRATCRRAGACLGEPMHCLAAALPLLPPEVVAELKLGRRKTRRGRAR